METFLIIMAMLACAAGLWTIREGERVAREATRLAEEAMEVLEATPKAERKALGKAVPPMPVPYMRDAIGIRRRRLFRRRGATARTGVLPAKYRLPR